MCTQTLKALSSQMRLVNQTQASHTLKNINIMSHRRSVTTSDALTIKCAARSKLVSYTAHSEDDDVAQRFIDMLEEDIKQIHEEHLRFPKEMKYTKSDEVRFQAATECHICEGELGGDRARDHCHLTGKFRGAAHESCNVNYQIPKFFPLIYHNLSGYHSHFFIKKLKGKCEHKNQKIKCIPRKGRELHYIQQRCGSRLICEGWKKFLGQKRLIYGFQFRCIIKESWQ